MLAFADLTPEIIKYYKELYEQQHGGAL